MLNANNPTSAHTNAIGSLGMTTDPINPNTPSANKMILILSPHLEIALIQVKQ